MKKERSMYLDRAAYMLLLVFALTYLSACRPVSGDSVVGVSDSVQVFEMPSDSAFMEQSPGYELGEIYSWSSDQCQAELQRLLEQGGSVTVYEFGKIGMGIWNKFEIQEGELVANGHASVMDELPGTVEEWVGPDLLQLDEGISLMLAREAENESGWVGYVPGVQVFGDVDVEQDPVGAIAVACSADGWQLRDWK